MQRMRQRPGLRPEPRWGSLQRSPDPLDGLGEGEGDKDGRKLGKEGREGVTSVRL